MRRLILGLLSLLLALPALAQDRPPPALLVETDEVSKPLLLKRVEAEARIHGNVAETRLTLTFGNPLDRAVAGDLYVPLPEGATVSGYALDVAGVMVEGVVVEKDKARQVFEAEVRKGVDPGLVEWTKGNTFKTRVFPIPAKGSRTVMIRWVSEILPMAGVTRYRLPLDYRDPVDEFKVRIEVMKPGSAPAVEAGGPDGLAFGPWQDSFVAEALVKGAALTEDLVIRLPIPPAEGAATEIAADGTCYVQLVDTPKIPSMMQKGKLRRVGIFWDASGSRGHGDHGREIALLETWLSSLPGTLDVDLAILRHALEVRHFKVKKGEAGELLKALREVPYDGGTQMGALAPTSSPSPDLYLLFSDGLSTFGAEEPTGLHAPVYVISDDTAANHPFLRHIARSTGGAYFNLRRVSDADVLQNLGWTPFSFLRAEVVSGDVDGVYPDGPRPVAGAFTLAARLKSDTAEVVLHFGYGTKSLVKARHRIWSVGSPISS
ncbi:MAG: VIT domain-containing protein [Pseudomonadota bacterium]